MSKKSSVRSIVSGVLALTIAVGMLIGVTYAVFNDSSSTNVNTIQAGTLDVELVDASDNSLVGTTVDFAGTNLLWQPDGEYTLETVYIKNNGDLDLKYKIVVTGIDGSGDIGEWIDWSVKVNGVDVDLSTYEATLAAGADKVPVVLVGTMKHDTPNSVMGKTAEGISITVYAKQTTEQAEYPAA